MGQNCVAGTTEFDDENGIGLVMYVESGNNMIVWKMSDGTKQGTTVPVSSDYQNMLRSAFENKTGTRIGYFIFHTYTEETIDIESSITINSGDTPVTNTLLFKKAAGQQFIIAKYSEEQKTLELACGVGTTALIVTDNQGKVNSLQGPPFNDMKSSFKGAVEYAGHEVDTTSIWELSINVDDTVEDWDSYISV